MTQGLCSSDTVTMSQCPSGDDCRTPPPGPEQKAGGRERALWIVAGTGLHACIQLTGRSEGGGRRFRPT